MEVLKEKRRQEKMAKVLKERERQRFIENQRKAVEFSRRLLLRRIGMEGFKRLLQRKRENLVKSEEFRCRLFKKNAFRSWHSYAAYRQREKETEERRQRWRMKIWELLPDYKPREDSLW